MTVKIAINRRRRDAASSARATANANALGDTTAEVATAFWLVKEEAGVRRGAADIVTGCGARGRPFIERRSRERPGNTRSSDASDSSPRDSLRRYREEKRGSLARHAFEPDPAPVRFDDSLRDRKAESRSALVRRPPRIPVAVEDERLVGGGNSGPGIGH